MKKILFVVIVFSTFYSSAQEQNKLLQPKRKLFPPRTWDDTLPYKTHMSLFSGVELINEMNTLQIGIEIPTSSRISFMTSFGYGFGGRYDYSQFSNDKAIISLVNDKLSFQINSGFHFYFHDLNNRSNYFFGLNMSYSDAYYSGQHEVQKKWEYIPPQVVFYVIPIPGYYNPREVHTNQFQLRAETVGLQLYLGWKKVILNRLPFEISLGCAFRKQQQELINYEASTKIPSETEFKTYDPFAIPFLTLKLGYLLFKK